jgi:LuxR family maltose regulon positive regulatory protein
MAEMPLMTNLASDVSPQDSLLTTKLYIPHPRSDRVLRPRLIARLNEALRRQHKLILISAPAGFGKTTLLSEWSQSSEWSVAWLSLDEGDNDLTRFLVYFITALQTIRTDIGKTALTLLHASRPQPPAIEVVLTSLVNEISALLDNPSTPPLVAGPGFALVLDDYHLISVQSIHHALTFLLDHLPPSMHLIIASRTDPPLPLARLRIRSELTELRAADLRFRPDEIAAFFNQVIGLSLPVENVVALEARTEGWIAGLQVAALSMQGCDPEHLAEFIQTFTGGHRYLMDYLAEEVLHRQPESLQTFLLQTSILDRLSSPLCEAVTGQIDGLAILERLERANLFIIPLDDDRQWYRYHHLFADFLRHRLQQTYPGTVARLHHRASEWYEQHGQLLEAIGHALAAPDFERAGGLIEQIAPTMFARQEITTVLKWLEALPEAQVRARPRLSLAYAWVLASSGQLDAVEPRLRDVESHFGFSIHSTGSVQVLDFGPETEATIQNPRPSDGQSEIPKGHNVQNREVRGQIAAIRSMVACFRGEVAQAVRLSRQALENLPEDALYLRSTMAVNIALNLLASNDSTMDVAEASQVLAEAASVSQASGDTHTALLSLTFLAETEAVRGQLHQAAQTFKQVLDLAGHPAAQSGQSLPVASAAHIGLGDLLYEWNDLDAAAKQLQRGIELSEREEDRGVWAIGYIPLAHLYQAQGAPDTALKMIQQAEQVARKSNIFWLKTRVAAHRARLWLRQGNVAAAVAWAERCGLRVGADIGYRREGEYATLARIWLAQSKVDQALNLLAWLLDVTEGANLTRSVVEILIIQALAFQSHQGKPTAAIIALERALSLAEPEGYIRTFVDEGAPLAHLLHQAASRSITSTYIRKLLAAFSEATDTVPAMPQPLVEPLTERELEVLALIAAGMTNQESAQKLMITVGTVKRHLHNIYSKLNVSHRTQAIAQARELKLLPE